LRLGSSNESYYEYSIGVELSYKRLVVRLLDRPGGRFLLGKAATLYLQRHAGDQIEIVYRLGRWTRHVNSNFFPDSLSFDYSFQDFNLWKQQMARYTAETEEYWLYQYRPMVGDVIVDVGAGRGEDTITFSRAVGETGRVIAIEAHPGSFAILQNFCRLNGLTNVIPLHVALMDKNGEVRILESGSSWLENVVAPTDGGSGPLVPSRTLDDICAEHGVGKISFLKMNIEGSERYALRGMQAVLPQVQQICVACHDFRSNAGDGEEFRTRTIVEHYLEKNGFSVRTRQDDARDYVRDHVFGVRAG
jgi:FkbM family methyltransferase